MILDDRLLIDLSAYADGELSSDEARRLEDRLVKQPELRRELEVLKRMDAEARALPVPKMRENIEPDWRALSGRAAQDGLDLDRAAGEFSVPRISAERFNAAWKDIAARSVKLAQDGDADAAWNVRLAKTAAALRAPLLSELAAREVWHEIAQRTVRVEKKERASTERIENAAPKVSGERWDTVWKTISGKTVKPPASDAAISTAGQPAREQVEAEEFAGAQTSLRMPSPRIRRRSLWHWFAAAGVAAAAILLPMLLGGNTPSDDANISMQIPSAVDQRYHVQVKYIPGQSQPLVCFVLDDDDDDASRAR